MSAARQPYEQRITTDRGAVHVQCRPRGAHLRDYAETDQGRRFQWRLVTPGLLGLTGLLLHHTLYRRQWEVLAVRGASGGGERQEWVAANRSQAEQTFAGLIVWLQEGGELIRYKPPRGALSRVLTVDDPI